MNANRTRPHSKTCPAHIYCVWIAVCCLFCLLATHVLAAEEADDSAIFELDEVVSATRQTTVLESTSAFGEVISQAELQAGTGITLGDALGYAGSVQIRDYGPGNLSGVSLRGSTSEQVLVLIDGERLNNAQSGGADLSQILLDGVQRIEVLRGGQSALYGADAMGGILYIVTNTRRKSHARLDMGLGSFGAQQWHADTSYRWHDLSGSLSYARDESEGTFEFADRYGNTQIRTNARYAHENARAAVEWRGPGTLRITGEHFEGDQGIAGPLGQTRQNAYQTDHINALRTRWEHVLSDASNYHVGIHTRNHRLHYVDLEPYHIDARHQVRSLGAEAQGTHRWTWRVKQPLTFGVAVRQDVVDSSNVGDQQRDALGVYVQQEWHYGPASLFPAIRLDTYSDFDAGVSPKFGWRVELQPGISIKGNLGRSYRAPVLNDLYWPEDAFAKGNPDLQPERSTDFDLGLHARTTTALLHLSGSVAVFRNEATNRILWSPSQGGKWSPVNLDHATHQGLEFEGRMRWQPLQADANYTYLEAADASGNQLIYQAQHTLNGSLRLGNDRAWIKSAMHYQSKRYFTRSNTRWLDGFLTQDVQLGLQKAVGGSAHLQLIGEIRNVWDTEYQLVKDYPLPGRELRLKTSIQWGGNP